jgi:hypothetical protein
MKYRSDIWVTMLARELGTSGKPNRIISRNQGEENLKPHLDTSHGTRIAELAMSTSRLAIRIPMTLVLNTTTK